jgi:rod shape-determining protein MreC
MPFFSKLFRVSGLVYGKTPAYGIVSWEGDNYDELSMDYVPATIEIQEGDLIVTSGYSNIYPPNIPIGQVDRIERSPGIETQKIYLRPEASLFDLTAGFVLVQQPDSSRTAIVEAYKKQFQ